MNFINFTPHPIAIIQGNTTRITPSSGEARVASTMVAAGEVDGVAIIRQIMGDVEYLPEPGDGTYIIVSRMVAAACPDRQDLLVPALLVRNTAGEVIGCGGFEQVFDEKLVLDKPVNSTEDTIKHSRI